MLQKHQKIGETLWNILLKFECHYLQKLAVLVLLGAPVGGKELCSWGQQGLGKIRGT